MSEKDHKGDGKTHTVHLRYATLTYWGNGVATGYKGADKVEVKAPYGSQHPRMDLKLPEQIPELLSILGLMSECFTMGKRKAKHELRRWLEIE